MSQIGQRGGKLIPGQVISDGQTDNYRTPAERALTIQLKRNKVFLSKVVKVVYSILINSIFLSDHTAGPSARDNYPVSMPSGSLFTASNHTCTLPKVYILSFNGSIRIAIMLGFI